VGSISSWTAPGCQAIARLVERVHGDGGLISVDPNIRAALADGPVGASLGNSAAVVRERLDRLVARADVVKVSAEDLEWLDPDGGADLDAAAQRWADRGVALVVLTDGGAPLRVARPGHPLLRREPPRVAVADTVGAGDSLAAGLLGGLLTAGVTTRTGLERLTDEELCQIVDDASLVAALNCTRVGADPPTRAELDAARAAR
jgi:fructokinase